MNGTVPHIVQYQGSKRKLAPQILRYMPEKVERLVEPFSGMAAISVAAARYGRSDSFWINDLNEPLVKILDAVVNSPRELLKQYRTLWNEQFFYGDNHTDHFYAVRDRFNSGDQDPVLLLYLIARCVKGAVRYGKDGKFNQSPDKRRHGTSPDNMEKNVYAISELLRRKASFSALDYHDVFNKVKPGDLVYMDPPYQGVTNTRDNRYLAGVDVDEFSEALEMLNKKGVDFIISYDGVCGEKTYGKDLPESLRCKKIMINAGKSTQATLLGNDSETVEALYISEGLQDVVIEIPHQLSFLETAV